jgi:hypothetical protein
MNNLFFVWTPFQLFVAQNIIIQEKLENNMLLLGFVENNKHFYDSYDLMIVDFLWSKIYKIDKLPSYATLGKKTLLKDILRLSKYEKKINQIIEQDKINTLYMGDINNLSCKFSTLNYSKRNINIVFFEEGISHYYSSQIATRGGSLFNKFISKAIDVFFFKPKYHFPFAKYAFYKSLSFKTMPIDARFSIVPVYHESYDRQLHISNTFSCELENYINVEHEKLKSISCGKETILFLSQPIDETNPNPNPNVTLSLLNVIRNFFSDKFFCNKLIVLKFHPRDTDENKIQIRNLLKEINLETHILSNEYAIPVELYLIRLKFNRIVTIFSSTFMYAGYIFPKIPIDFLITDYIEECKKYHIDTTNLEKTMNEVIDKIKLFCKVEIF